MSVARTGALPNSYKFYTIAVNRFENRRLEGLVFHESREDAVVFKSLTQMACVLNRMFDENHYPMKSVDQRCFRRKMCIRDRPSRTHSLRPAVSFSRRALIAPEPP